MKKEGDKKDITRRDFLKASGTVALGLTLGTFGQAPAIVKAQSKQPIRIGEIRVLSGGFAHYGNQAVRGGRLAVEEINAMGGIMGRPIEFVVKDSEGKPAVGVQRAQELILQNNVDFLLGITVSSVLLAVMEIAERYKKILVCTNAATDLATGEKCSPYMFRTSNNAAQCAISGAEIFAKMPYKKWAIIGPDYAYGHSCWDSFIKQLKKLKPDVQVVYEGWPKFMAPEYNNYITGCLNAKPEAVYSSFWSTEIIAFIKQAQGYDFFDKIGAFAVNDGLMLEVAQTLQDNIPFDKYWGGTEYFPYMGDILTPNTKENNDFVNKFYKQYGEYPEYVSEEDYAGVYFIKHAVEKAGTLDTNKVIAAMEGLTWDSPEGKKYMRPGDHQVMENVLWAKLQARKNGKRFPFPTIDPKSLVITPPEKSIWPLAETGCKMRKP
jgi:branched-chain amino acid transport system substrate-binding protein